LSDISDPNDLASRNEQQMLAAALSQTLGKGQKKELVPSTLCYGCFADLSEQDQLAGAIYCPDSSEECRGYHQMELRQKGQRYMPPSSIYADSKAAEEGK